jgi:hypothetical protein
VLDVFRKEIGPAPIPNGVRVGDVYGQCAKGSEIGWEPPFTEVVDCGSGLVDFVDMTTGIVKRVNGFSTGSTTSAGSLLHLAGTEVVWTDGHVRPVQGLSEGGYVVTLHLRDLSAKIIADVQVAQGQSTGVPLAAGQIAAAWDNRVLVTNLVGATMYDGNGRVLWTRPDSTSGYAERLTASTLLLGSRANLFTETVLINADTGASISTDFGSQQDHFSDGCYSYVASRGKAQATLLSESVPGRIDIKTLAFGLVNTSASLTPVGDELVTDYRGGLSGYSIDGTELWSIPGTVVQQYWTLGKWIMATNTSGQQLLVDSVTVKTRAQPTQ